MNATFGMVPAQVVQRRMEILQELAGIGDAIHFPKENQWIWSDKTYRLFGYEPGTRDPGMDMILERLHSGDVLRVTARIRDWLSGRLGENTLEFRILLSSGRLRWLRIIPAFSRDSRQMMDEGQELFVYGVQDISHEKALEEEMLRAVDHERKLSRVKMEFLHMVTHEYRTPLGVIQSSVDILHRYFERLSEEERVGRLEDIKRSTRRLSELVEDVLMLGRAESGRVQVNLQTFDPVSLVHAVADEVVEGFGFPREVDISVDNLSPQFRSDEQLLRHILGNAISNALKYSTLDQPVHVSLKGKGENLQVSVRDHGIGIPQEDREQLFRMFHRGSNVGSISGTGLGLVIIKRCLDQLGGRVSLRSEVGKGTELLLTLPSKPESHGE